MKKANYNHDRIVNLISLIKKTKMKKENKINKEMLFSASNRNYNICRKKMFDKLSIVFHYIRLIVLDFFSIILVFPDSCQIYKKSIQKSIKACM